jgi:hypothetical protein
MVLLAVFAAIGPMASCFSLNGDWELTVVTLAVLCDESLCWRRVQAWRYDNFIECLPA